VQRLEFTSLPENTDVPLIAADAVYNLRSALDHPAPVAADRPNAAASCCGHDRPTAGRVR
jgi:hypothetical protein